MVFIVYKPSNFREVHLWYDKNLDHMLNYHGHLLNEKFAIDKNSNINVFRETDLNDSLCREITTLYIHSRHSFGKFDFSRFTSLRVLMLMDKFRIEVINFRQPDITIICDRVPVNIELIDRLNVAAGNRRNIKNKVIHTEDGWRHKICMRTSYLATEDNIKLNHQR